MAFYRLCSLARLVSSPTRLGVLSRSLPSSSDAPNTRLRLGRQYNDGSKVLQRRGTQTLSEGKTSAKTQVDTAVPIVDRSDSMTRWPSFYSAGGVLRALDWVGTVSFAHSGTILAATSGMDFLGTAVVGTITAVGGGTIRDAIFLCRQPFWTSEIEYLMLCFATASITFFAWPYFRDSIPDDHSALFIGDTLGIGAFCVIGAQNGIRAGMPAFVSLICGVATATFGGAVRDVLCKRDVRILHSHAEIYASTAAGGASAYLIANMMGASLRLKILAGVGTGIFLRHLAWTEGIRLPVWPHDDKQ